MIKVSGRVNIRGAFNEVLKKIERAMIPALDNEIAVIKARTLAGNDVKGGSFRPYSEDYREFKGKATNTPNPTVNLSGVPGASAPQFKMLQSIFSSVEVQGSKVIGTISFNNAAAAIKAAANQKTRRFFWTVESATRSTRNNVKEGDKMRLRNVFLNAEGGGSGSGDVVPKSEYEKAVERSRKFEAQLTDTEKKLKGFEGVDLERVRAEREELEILRKQGVGNDPKKLDELLERTRKETEEKLSKRFGDKLTEFEKQNGELSKELKHIRVTKSALDVAAKMFLPEAIKFVEPIINASCDWVDGKIVVKDEKGDPRYSKKNPKEPMTVEELLSEVAESNPFLVPASTVRGTDNGASKSGSNPKATRLPGDFESWPMERKQTFFRENPEVRRAYLAGAL